MRGIPIDILRAFVGVVEARGFTRAAEELGRTQPTISLQVKRLEELVEAPLFKKGGRFELSPVGEVCFDYGKRLLRLHDDMLDELGRNNPNDAIRIGMPSEFAAILAPRLNELRANAQVATTFEIIVDSSQRFRPPFVKTRLTSLSSSGPARASRTGSNNGEVNCAGSARRLKMNTTVGRCRSFCRRKDGRFTRRRLSRCAPRNGDSRSSARVQILPCSQPPRLPGLASRQ